MNFERHKVKKIKGWKMQHVEVIQPLRREVKAIGRLTILGKLLTIEQTKNYLKAQ